MCEKKTNNASAKETKEDSANSPKKFSKVKFMQQIGLLSSKFNYETHEFENSLSLRLVFSFSLLSKMLFSCPFFVSCFFEKTDVAQLFIGRQVNIE